MPFNRCVLTLVSMGVGVCVGVFVWECRVFSLCGCGEPLFSAGGHRVSQAVGDALV